MMRVIEYGWDSLLLEVDDPAGWFRALTKSPEVDVDEIVPGAKTVLLQGVRSLPEWGSLEFESLEPVGDEVVIPVVWDGADLGALGSGIIDALRDNRFTVAFCGFMPGFAYLSGLPEKFQVPRLATPRKLVPQGSVAIAGPYAGIYPREAPGGWNLVGTTNVTLFDLSQSDPALLKPGMSVRFVDA